MLSEVFMDIFRQAGRLRLARQSRPPAGDRPFKALPARRRRVDAELDEKIPKRIVGTADTPKMH